MAGDANAAAVPPGARRSSASAASLGSTGTAASTAGSLLLAHPFRNFSEYSTAAASAPSYTPASAARGGGGSGSGGGGAAYASAAAGAAAHISPAVWLVVWLVTATMWLRGYMGALFYGSRLVVLTPEAHHRADAAALGALGPRSDALAAWWGRTWAQALVGCRAGEGPAPAPSRAEVAVAVTEVVVPLAGAALAGWLSRRSGRHTTVAVGVGVMVFGQTVGAITLQYGIYFAGYASYIAGSVMTLQATLIEVVETVPAPSRGRLTALGSFASALGMAMADGVIFGLRYADWRALNWRWGYQLSLLLCLWPAVLLLAVLPWMIDTPGSLLQHGHFEEARQALQALRGELADVSKEFEAVAHTVNEGKGRSQLSQLMERRARPGLVLAVLAALIAGLVDPLWLSESNAAQAHHRPTGSPAPYFVIALLPRTSFIVGSILAILFADRLGRRRLMLYGSLCVTLFGAPLAAIMFFPDAGWGPRVAALCLFYLMHVASAAGWAFMHFLIVAENLSINTRAAGVSLHVAIYYLFYRTVKQGLARIACRHWWIVMVLYSMGGLIGAAFSYYLVPETAGVPLDAVPARCHWSHPFWRRFARPPPAAAGPPALRRLTSGQRGGGEGGSAGE